MDEFPYLKTELKIREMEEFLMCRAVYYTRNLHIIHCIVSDGYCKFTFRSYPTSVSVLYTAFELQTLSVKQLLILQKDKFQQVQPNFLQRLALL